MISAMAPTRAPTNHPKQKPLTKIMTVINSIRPGRNGMLKPLAYATTIAAADNTDTRAISFVSTGIHMVR